MTDAGNDFRSNIFGALLTALSDAQRQACELAAGHEAAAPAALIAIEQYPAEAVRFFEPILGLTSSGTVRLFDRLTTAGLIQRRAGHDARTRAVSLTPAGEVAAESVRLARRSVLAGALSSLSSAETQQLAKITEKMLTSLSGSRIQARRLCRLCDHRCCDNAGRCPVDLAVTAAGYPRYEHEHRRAVDR